MTECMGEKELNPPVRAQALQWAGSAPPSGTDWDDGSLSVRLAIWWPRRATEAGDVLSLMGGIFISFILIHLNSNRLLMATTLDSTGLEFKFQLITGVNSFISPDVTWGEILYWL